MDLQCGAIKIKFDGVVVTEHISSVSLFVIHDMTVCILWNGRYRIHTYISELPLCAFRLKGITIAVRLHQLTRKQVELFYQERTSSGQVKHWNVKICAYFIRFAPSLKEVVCCTHMNAQDAKINRKNTVESGQLNYWYVNSKSETLSGWVYFVVTHIDLFRKENKTHFIQYKFKRQKGVSGRNSIH